MRIMLILPGLLRLKLHIRVGLGRLRQTPTHRIALRPPARRGIIVANAELVQASAHIVVATGVAPRVGTQRSTSGLADE